MKNAIRELDGTAIIVSHDREFLDGLATKVYEFGNQKVKEHLYGIYEFLEKKKIESLQELELQVKNTSNSNNNIQQEKSIEKDNKVSYEERKELSRNIKRIEKKIE